MTSDFPWIGFMHTSHSVPCCRCRHVSHSSVPSREKKPGGGTAALHSAHLKHAMWYDCCADMTTALGSTALVHAGHFGSVLSQSLRQSSPLAVSSTCLRSMSVAVNVLAHCEQYRQCGWYVLLNALMPVPSIDPKHVAQLSLPYPPYTDATRGAADLAAAFPDEIDSRSSPSAPSPLIALVKFERMSSSALSCMSCRCVSLATAVPAAAAAAALASSAGGSSSCGIAAACCIISSSSGDMPNVLRPDSAKSSCALPVLPGPLACGTTTTGLTATSNTSVSSSMRTASTRNSHALLSSSTRLMSLRTSGVISTVLVCVATTLAAPTISFSLSLTCVAFARTLFFRAGVASVPNSWCALVIKSWMSETISLVRATASLPRTATSCLPSFLISSSESSRLAASFWIACTLLVSCSLRIMSSGFSLIGMSVRFIGFGTATLVSCATLRDPADLMASIHVFIDASSSQARCTALPSCSMSKRHDAFEPESAPSSELFFSWPSSTVLRSSTWSSSSTGSWSSLSLNENRLVPRSENHRRVHSGSLELLISMKPSLSAPRCSWFSASGSTWYWKNVLLLFSHAVLSLSTFSSLDSLRSSCLPS
eukprot:Unigene8186_Nuclearia_a/m.25123 Unigene8186_Nuclearia_a/g.25123  ORF Unigene8186_Nuclearia_a/g.25123 Unigene8186_Nuclearia_a/m.25123 type:complete len:596 (-) Unigene8186_Nuclearia_a:328-2115(-)